MRRFIALALCLSLIALVACSREQVTKAYLALEGAGHTYNQTMHAVANLDAAGKISADAKRNVIKYGTAFYGAYHAAMDAYSTYLTYRNPTHSQTERVLALIAEAMNSFPTFVQYARDVGVLVEG